MSNDNENELKKDGKQGDASPFVGRESDPNKQIEITEFSTWYSKIFLNELKTHLDHPVTSAENDSTSTIKYFVVYIKPKQDYIDFIEGVQEYVCFWIKNFFILKESFDELEKYIKTLFSSLIAEKSIFPLLKGDIKDVQLFRQAKLRKEQIETKEKKRFVFHYIAHQTDNTPLDGIEFLNCNNFPLKDLLEISGESSLFIFDRDKAGSLYPIFSEYAQSKNLESHLISFFACGENELLPRSSDYPIDLFTSCLNSPARIALVWHSRQYFCFQSGSLQPLSLMFVEEMEAINGTNTASSFQSNEKLRIKAILDDLTTSLCSVVESIALHSMEPKLFAKFFRSDKVLSKLTINFIFACRILSIFNIHPISYPKMPDMSNSSEWHTFALRLDASLYILNHPEEDPASSMLSHHHFLSQVLITFQNKIDINTSNLNVNSNPSKNFEVPFELSFLKSILNDEKLCEPALKTLAKYLDSSPVAIMFTLYYPIPKTLFKLLIKNGFKVPSKYLIFCLVKILAYHQPARSLLLKMKTSYQNSIKKVLIDTFKNCLAGNLCSSLQSFSSFSSLSSLDSIPKSLSLSSKPNSFAPESLIASNQIAIQNLAQENDVNIQIVSSTSLNFSSRKVHLSKDLSNYYNASASNANLANSKNSNKASSNNISSNNVGSDKKNGEGNCDESSTDLNSSLDSEEIINECKTISHLLMILFALLMKDSFKLFKDIVLAQDIFLSSSSSQSIFSQPTIDQLDLDSKIWLLLIIKRASDATKDYQIIKTLLSLILKVYNSKQGQYQTQLIQLSKSLQMQPPPELHAPIVCSLSSLIKGERSIVRTTQNVVQIRETIEHKATNVAFNFFQSSLVNVRLELFVMAQKFIEANPQVFSADETNDLKSTRNMDSSNDSIDVSNDGDNEQLYKKVTLCVEQSKKDPCEKVKNARESNLFQYFISALLNPIRKMLFGPFSLDEVHSNPFQFDHLFTLSSTVSESSFQTVPPSVPKSASSSNMTNSSSKHSIGARTVRPQRKVNSSQNLMKELVVNSSYRHSCQITTDLLLLQDQKIAFGDVEGVLNIKDWDSGPRYQILPQKGKEPKIELKEKAKISPNPLNCIEFYENGNSNPLLFSVDSNANNTHSCYVSNLLDDYSLSTAAVFPLFNDDTIYIDKKRGQLYSFSHINGNQFNVRDLRTDSFLPSICPKFGLTKDIKSISYFDDVVALCGRAFECFDLRESATEPKISIYNDFIMPPHSLRIIDESIPTFAIALEGHIAVYLDIRQPDCFQSIPVECICQDEDRKTFGFDFSKKSMMAALSTEHGITCVHVQRHYQNDVLNKKNAQKLTNSTSLLFHPEKYELAFVNNHEYIITSI